MNKSTSPLTSLIGLILITVGAIAAFMGPVEIYCYYLFSEGGRFHYEGFGVGSFMFGNITLQIIGYYIIAFIFIPLGYGHLKRKIWIQNVSLSFLWFWLIVGIPLTPLFLFILISSKEPSLFVIVISAIICTLLYTLVPFLLIKFYKSKSFENNLTVGGFRHNNFLNYPIPLTVLIMLYFFYITAFHLLLLYRGIFPFFGRWLLGLPGVTVITIVILFHVVLIWGTVQRRLWAWWTALAYFTLFALSAIITLLSTHFSEIVTLLRFPATEYEALSNIPLKGIHLALIFGLPLIITLCVIIFSKNQYTKAHCTKR